MSGLFFFAVERFIYRFVGEALITARTLPCAVRNCVIASAPSAEVPMPPASQYFLIDKPAGPQAQAALAEHAAQGWRPILMSTSTLGSGAIHVFILLEKPTGTAAGGTS